MNIRNLTRPLTPMGLGLATLGGLLCVNQAHADKSAAYAQNAWYVEITHMPDLDQRRDQLPGDGGAYCVPTSAMNLMAYFALHGGDNPPGIANWRSFSGYNTMSGLLQILGAAMGTDPSNGTTIVDAMNGYTSWLDEDDFDFSAHWATWSWNPRHEHVGLYCAMYGGYCNVHVGWYNENGSFITRNNGHAMTMVKAAQSGSDRVISFRDPATDEGQDWVQSPYTTESYSISRVTRTPTIGGEQLASRVMSRVNGLMAGSRQAYIDGLVVVTPKFALTGLQNGGFVMERHAIDDGDETSFEYQPFTERRICGARFGADGQIIFMICPLDSDDVEEVQVGYPGIKYSVIEPANGQYPAVVDGIPGRNNTMYLMDREYGLMHIRMDDEMEVLGQRSIPFLTNIDSFTWDEPEDNGADGIIWSISTSNSVIVRNDAGNLDSGFQAVYEIDADWALPDGIKINAVPGTWGTFLAWTPGDNRIWRLQLVGQILQVMDFWDMAWTVESLTFDDRRRVLMIGDGSVHEYRLNESGQIEDEPNPLFAGMEAHNFILLSRSWNNYDPVLHFGPDWDHELPTLTAESVADCPADLNGDFVIDVEDLLQLLASWGDDDPYADIAPVTNNGSGDGTVDVNDLLMLLQEWGDCS